jgi:glycosylphosphatidylinositol transamidase (GPIT) subunit GPI8
MSCYKVLNKFDFIIFMKPLIIFINILAVIIAQKAFLFSSSVGYYNYRQNANVLKIYEMLKNEGFEDEDLILSLP